MSFAQYFRPSARGKGLSLKQFTALCWFFGILLAVFPIFTVEYLPLIDYASHLVRQFILIHFNDLSALQANYQIDWSIKPNLGMDVAIPLLSKWMPLAIASKLFVILTFLLLIGGECSVAYALHGKVGPFPFVSILLLYSSVFFIGLLNCLAATGLMLFGLSYWILTNQWRSSIRAIGLSCLSVIIFFTHLFPFAIFIVLVGSYELDRMHSSKTIAWKSLLTILLSQIPILFLWSLKAPGPPSSNLYFGNIGDRLYSIVSPAIFHQTSDLAIIWALFFGGLLYWKYKKSLPIAPQMQLPLLALAIVTLIMPRGMMGGGEIHLRTPLAFAFVLLASISPNFIPARAQKFILAFVLLIIGIRSIDIAIAWQKTDAQYQEYRNAARVMEPGARIIAMNSFGVDDANNQLFYHISDLAILDRCIFAPQMQKIPDQQPVLPSKKTLVIDGGTAMPINLETLMAGSTEEGSKKILADDYYGWAKPYYANWPKNFDYVVYVHDRQSEPNPLSANLSKVADGSFFEIYRINNHRVIGNLNCTLGP